MSWKRFSYSPRRSMPPFVLPSFAKCISIKGTSTDFCPINCLTIKCALFYFSLNHRAVRGRGGVALLPFRAALQFLWQFLHTTIRGSSGGARASDISREACSQTSASTLLSAYEWPFHAGSGRPCLPNQATPFPRSNWYRYFQCSAY